MENFEEFHEADVMFTSDYSWDRHINGKENGRRHWRIHRLSSSSSSGFLRNGKKQQQKMISSPMSVPVNVPTRMGFSRYDIDLAGEEPSDQSSSSDEDLDYEEDEIYGRLPPHLIIERRESGEIARSFGPLKGRHLSQVRNSILRMTGFLER